MRVAILTHNAQSGDAIGNQLAEKAAYFRDRGADVRVVLESTFRLHPRLRRLTWKVRSPEPAGRAWEFARTADLLVAEFGQYYPLLDWLPLLAEGGGGRIVVDYHGITPPELGECWQCDLLTKSIRQRDLVWCADDVLVHSRFTRDELIRATGYPAERVHQLGYALDLDWYRPGRPLRRIPRLGDARTLLFVGRLAPNKRISVLIDALDQLRDLRPALHAVIVGDNTDIYEAEYRRCLQKAADLNLSGRVHFLGPVSERRLRDCYRSADVFVMPSVHEGYCVPVMEAVACGLPVVAARAAALPETVGGNGFTFAPDDAADLARQVRRALAVPEAAIAPRRVAVVAPRYGEGVVGGLETSLRRAAETLHDAGERVEVFATFGAAGGRSRTETVNGVPVHRFPADGTDPEALHRAARRIESSRAGVSPDVERTYLAHSLRSRALVEALGRRIGDFDRVLVGPYLTGLTYEVARRFPDRTVLVPCFHDEGFARLPRLLRAYDRVQGVFYHSEEEKHFAEVELGFNHPNGVRVGTWIQTDQTPRPGRGEESDGSRGLVYCGRASEEKNARLLFQHLERYRAERGPRFTLTLIGDVTVELPAADWVVRAGRVGRAEKARLLAKASALVQLSLRESLSLAVLEAWAVGVPVIGHAGCAAVAGQVRRSGGGVLVDSYAGFRDALDGLWHGPAAWARRGADGQRYVRQAYGDRGHYLAALCRLLDGQGEGRRERLRAEVSRPAWRRRLDEILAHEHSRPRGRPAPPTATPAAPAALPLAAADPTRALGEVTRLLEEAGRMDIAPPACLPVGRGPLARLKAFVRRKLLHQFQVRYVDAVILQQTRVNTLTRQALDHLRAALAARAESRPGKAPRRSGASDGTPTSRMRAR